MSKHNAFTVRYNGRVRVLTTKAQVGLPFSKEEFIEKTKLNESFRLNEYFAIWDTGATNCVITKRVVDDLGLKPIKVVEVNHAGGKSLSNVYLVNIGLPNHVMIGAVQVTEGVLVSGSEEQGTQPNVLIGMDIIGQGDFAVTNFDGKTVMSFKLPSSEVIDFVPTSNQKNLLSTAGNRHQRRAIEAQFRKKNKNKW